MLTREEQTVLRGKLFRHLDGIVISPIAFFLNDKGVIDYLIDNKSINLSKLTDYFKANEGYLNVALRCLCSQGWLTQSLNSESDEIIYSVNSKSATAFDHFHLYEDVTRLMQLSEKYHPRIFQIEPFVKLEEIYKNFRNRYFIKNSDDPLIQEIQQQVFSHIEGVIVGPTLVHLGMTGMFHKYFMTARFKAEEFHKEHEAFSRLLDILTDLGYFRKFSDSYEFTDKGLFFAKRASAYGVTVSYIPTLRKLDHLIFGDAKILKRKNSKEKEYHVDREMNVWGSGGAHAAYFKVVDEIIVEIFNRPLESQPKGILDMGCGNGAFLIHLFNVIESKTLRGGHLEEFPLTLIGVDYNEAALKVSKENLINADIWAKVIWGDIGKPDLLSDDLNNNYGIDLKELLNVRTFLDHNRIWEKPEKDINRRLSKSSGAYAYEGKRLNNSDVMASMKAHFNKWVPYVKRFGLLLIELHTVKPSIVASNIGKTAATAYDATHGFSDQYIVEVDEYMTTMQELGLQSEEGSFRKYPDSELATVSINLFKSK